MLRELGGLRRIHKEIRVVGNISFYATYAQQ